MVAPRKLSAALAVITRYYLDESYIGLRDLAFQTPPAELGLQPAPREVWGVLMEIGFEQGVSTLLALADGAISLYSSSGGGTIGLGGHDGPRAAADEWLAAAQQYVWWTAPTSRIPLPLPGRIRFYFLTGSGIRTIEAGEEELLQQSHPFSPYFFLAQALLTRIRLHLEGQPAAI